MRKLYFLVGLLFAFQPTFGQLLTEPFNYTPHATNGLGTQSGGTWIAFNTGDEVLVQSGNLNYTGLVASSGNSIVYGGAGMDYYRTFTGQTAGTVYYSILVNISTLGTINTTGGYFAGFIDNGTSNFYARLWARLSGSSNFNIGINAGAGAGNIVWASSVLSPGTTYLLVVSYQFNAGTGNDVAKVWINPAIGSAEPAQDALSTNTGSTDASSIQRFFVRQDATTSTAGNLTVDELRVGTTWSSVTPAPPLPVKFANIRAYQQGSGIRFDWSNLIETGVINYDVERSANGVNFTTVATVSAVRNDGGRADYSWFDAVPLEGISLYRVRSFETDGHLLYSVIVRVSTKGGINDITIYPNPASGNQVSFQATLPKGEYRVELVNAAGQKLYTDLLQHNGGTITEALQWPFTMKPGLYNLIISNGEIRISKSFMIR